ncbi:MAG: energy transducer TonB [Syntrophorhabdaceae bacterium]|nr:energy transducer TonB [Syntrophorhabdaceae bacterium]
MLRNRKLITFMGISLLFHVAMLLFAYLFPSAPPKKEIVTEVSIADIPRSEDFLPSKPGIIEGQRPTAPPPTQKEDMLGRVPDLPVKTDLPPEKSFPAPRPDEKEQRQAKTEKARQAKATEAEQADATESQSASDTEPSSLTESPESQPSSSGDSPRSLRDLTPTLGKLVMTQNEPSGGRGEGESRGSAAGTGGKASENKGVVEESGGGFRLTSLNAPEIQYISYFASIKRKIELVWQYPYDAAVQGIQGELQIDFVIGRNGKLESVELVRGSGYKILDEEAIRSIRKAAPFDPIPAEYNIPNLQIRGRFVYTHGGKLRIMR